MQSRLTAFCYVRISRSGFCATVETCDQELRKILAETAALVLRLHGQERWSPGAGRENPNSSLIPQDQPLVV